MRTVYLTRKEHFNAAHRLWNEEWDEGTNYEVFGPCANKNFHGHNFDLYVTVRGRPNPETGFIVNVKDLSTIIKEHVIEPLDHKNLNLDVPFMQDKMPSTENLAIAIWDELHPRVEAIEQELYKIRLFETENNCVEYFGEQ